MASRVTLALDWNADGTFASGPDGTEYGIFSEQVRGEPRYYEARYKDTGEKRVPGLGGGWKRIPIGDGGSDIRTQRTRCRRYAEQRLEASGD